MATANRSSREGIFVRLGAGDTLRPRQRVSWVDQAAIQCACPRKAGEIPIPIDIPPPATGDAAVPYSCAGAPPPGYLVKVEQVTIAGGDDLEIRSLLDRLQFDDVDGKAAQIGICAAAWPLFGQIWPSALALADRMQRWNVGACRVLEIGCGLGLASLVIHRRHGDVTASDRHPLVEAFLLDNLRRNELPPMKYAVGNWAEVNPRLGEFDLIVGSDVLYERDHSHQLADFIDRHAAQHADVLIVDPNRGNRSGFARCLQRSGFELTENGSCPPRIDQRIGWGRMLRFER